MKMKMETSQTLPQYELQIKNFIEAHQIDAYKMLKETVLHAILRKASPYDENNVLEYQNNIRGGNNGFTLWKFQIASKLIELGGDKLLLQKDDLGYTAMSLHSFWSDQCDYHAELLSQMLDVGGKELILSQNHLGETALFTAFANETASSKSKIMLIKVGGKDLLMLKKNDGRTILHEAIVYGTFKEISLMIELGGKDLVMATDNCGKTALHYMFDSAYNFRALPIVDKVLEQINFKGFDFDTLGERKFCMNVLEKYNLGACNPHRMMTLSEKDAQAEYATIPVRFAVKYLKLLKLITMMINIGGSKLLSMKDKVRSETVISLMFNNINVCPKGAKQKILIELFVELIEGQTLGEFGIGILFLDEIMVQQDNWRPIIVPALVSVMKQYCKLPILQAAIIHTVELPLILDIATSIDCLNIVDSKGRHPIRVGIEKDFGWNDGLRDIFEKYTDDQENNECIVNLALKYGLRWENGMRDIAEELVLDMRKQNQDSGLYPFMTMAEGENHDLSSIYKLLKMIPEIFA